MVFSFTLPSKEVLGTMSAAEINAIRVTPWIMIGLYFILTVAELFISPLGLSFVSKVAPPHLQGLMQGCWLAATAVGNSLLFIGGILYTLFLSGLLVSICRRNRCFYDCNAFNGKMAGTRSEIESRH